MAKTYIQDGDDVVEQSTNETVVDFTELVATFVALRTRYQNLPEIKTVPDQETLDAYNREAEVQRQFELDRIGAEATVLYEALTAIRDAGLLPAQYEDEYQTLKTFVEGL